MPSRYTHEGGVLVACRRRGLTLSIGVWDTGVGIPASEHERIFEEFFQIGNPERDVATGLGLGCRLHGASRTCSAASSCCARRQGRGSVFSFSVQLGDPAVVVHAPPELAVAGDALAGRCVIVIDR